MLNARVHGSGGAMAPLVIAVMIAGADSPDTPVTQAEDRSMAEQVAVSLENDNVRYVIGADGRNLHFIDKRTNVDYCDRKGDSSFARVKVGTQEHDASTVSCQGDRINVGFGQTGVRAVLKATAHKRYLVLEVVSLRGPDVELFTFIDVPLTLKITPEESFAACALALNLKTNVLEIPGPGSRLRAMCYPRFGFAKARVALIGCPRDRLREVMKEAVSAAPDLPHSTLGGPWALDAEINKGSYLFDFGDLSEKTVDEWVKLARDVGMNQIDFHGGRSFRFGDCRPNPKTYPRGLASLKAVVDRLHAAGLAAGLHTYAFFIAKDCPWVTPAPDPRLAKDATFTLAEALDAEATTVPVVESTKHMSEITGFHVRNSVTLQIDKELITYQRILKEAPYAFANCARGAFGTKITAHAKGAKVHHLKECFGLFVPDGDSTLFTEVARKTAEVYNECGFDMIYLDALDGSDVLAGAQNAWHYGSKFAFDVCKRLKRPAVMEMSTFHHHLWFVRSRMGAWDHPNRSHKKFIDIHCEANEQIGRMFLPGHLGWWAVKSWSGIQGEPTFSDDIEYLCAKCIGNDVGFSVMGINPNNIGAIPVYQRLGGIMKQYEALRHADYFDESVKWKLKEPGKAFTLFRAADGRWRFRRVQHAEHRVEGMNGWSNVWSASNPFAQQPLRLRIEALMSAGPYDAPANITLTDFADAREFADRAAAQGVTFELQRASDLVKAGKFSGVFSASNAGKTDRKGAWAKAGKTFAPPLDLSQHQALGVWVHGDGQGETLNIQLRSPQHITRGIGEHYIIVDFTGWRYFELIEPEGERYSRYKWPYGSPYSIYRENVAYRHVASLGLWYNDLPANRRSACYLSPIKAMPLVPARLRDPAITVNGRQIMFPVEMETGSYLEFHSLSDCDFYSPKGERIGNVKPKGEVPVLQKGANQVTFTCDGPTDVRPRANVTVILQGEPI